LKSLANANSAGCGFEEEQGLSVPPFFTLGLFHPSDFLLLIHITDTLAFGNSLITLKNAYCGLQTK